MLPKPLFPTTPAKRTIFLYYLFILFGTVGGVFYARPDLACFFILFYLSGLLMWGVSFSLGWFLFCDSGNRVFFVFFIEFEFLSARESSFEFLFWRIFQGFSCFKATLNLWYLNNMIILSPLFILVDFVFQKRIITFKYHKLDQIRYLKLIQCRSKTREISIALNLSKFI